GRRHASSEAALANYDALVASYRQTTLTAFQQVEDNLAALRVLAQETDQQQQAVTSARESLELSTNRYKGGVDTYLQVITAQTMALTNERNAVDILRRRAPAQPAPRFGAALAKSGMMSHAKRRRLSRPRVPPPEPPPLSS